MKHAILAAFAVTFSLSAFAGTEISQLSIQNSQEFFANQVWNFHVDSLTLDKDPVVVTDKWDDNCVATAEDAFMDCHTYTSVKEDVVHVNISFDSNEDQFEDGGNNISLSIPQTQFTAAELEQIKHDAYGKKTIALVKMNLQNFKSTVPTPAPDAQQKNPACLEEDDNDDCMPQDMVYTTTVVSKILVSVTR